MKDIAIIGVAGRFPQAANLHELRKNLMAGKDLVRDISQQRRAATNLAPDRPYMEIGYIEDIDLFDHRFFQISKAEAGNMDPHQRLLLEVVYEAIESAGYNMDHFDGSPTAVFIGDTEQEYYRLASQFDPTLITGSTSATTAGRIARFFNFRGNAAMVDTACSSSLLAVHLACNELILGDASYALACGVRFILFPDEKTGMPQVGILSGDGKTRSFSASADGSGAGESVGCVLLKPLDKAIGDGDIIYAVIKSTAVNQDARLSGSLTAPSSQAQAEVIRKAWQKAGIDSGTVTYIEAHGSGTKLGDPIEIAGMDLAFRGTTSKKHFCAVSSIKSNLGHTGGAAGITGLIKVLLSLRYRELYPSVHFDRPNPLIDFKNSAVYVNTIYQHWEADFPRRAGVSSFGLSGTNCHVLLEEGPVAGDSERGGADDIECRLFAFSARSVASLEMLVKGFPEYLQQVDAMAAISYTLNMGRKHYPYRMAVLASSAAELVEKMGHAPIFHAPRGINRIIFLFSGDSAVNGKLLAQIGNDHPALRKYMEACKADYAVVNDATARFILQYAIYQFLEDRGIGSDQLLGIGSGDLVVAVILNELPLEEALRQCLEQDSAEQGYSHNIKDNFSDLNKRLISLVERKIDQAGKESEAGILAFIELGPAGCLSRGLDLLPYPDKDHWYSVIRMEQSPLEIIRELYLQQFPIDWNAYYTGTKNKKILLPGYPFERTRCWIREMGPLAKEIGTAPDTRDVPTGGITILPVSGVSATSGAIIPDNWSAMEKEIASIWIDVLKLDELSLEDDFFRLGGHSLMATRVITAIEQRFACRLVFKDIFTFATVRSLAAGVEKLIAKNAEECGEGRRTFEGNRLRGQTVATKLQPATPQPFYPLSEAQRRLWLIHQTDDRSIAYNLPGALLLEGKLDRKRLENAFRSMISRHESLRTSFHEQNARPVQVVHAEVDFSIEQVGGGGNDRLAANDPDRILQAFLQPFDLSRAPLLRAAIATLQPDKHLLMLDMHHIISDGISQALFTADLVKLYHEEALPAVKIQYKDFAVWQVELCSNGSLQNQESFWLKKFSTDIAPLQFPTDRPRPELPAFGGDKLFFRLTAGKAALIQSLASQTGTTPFMVVLSVLHVLLYKYTGQEDIAIGTAIAGRSHPDLDKTLGMFVNTLVFRNQPAAEKPFLTFLEEIKEYSLDAFENQDYPFSLLVEKLDLKKEAARNPLFDVMLGFQNMEMPSLQLDDLAISPFPVNTRTSPFDLFLEIDEGKEDWPSQWVYNTSLFDRETILLLKERLLALLDDVLTDPGRTIGQLSCRIAAEDQFQTSGLDIAFNF